MLTHRLFGLWCRLNAVGGLDRTGALALRAFMRPPPPRITPKQQAFLAEARRSTLRYNDTRIAMYEWGDPAAPYVFTAYGWSYNAGRWRHFAPQLTEAGYRVVAFDYPGHGASDFDLMHYPRALGVAEAVLRHFGRPELLLAHSFGAGTSAGMLAQLPAELRPRRAVLMAGFSDVEYLFRQYTDALGLGAWSRAAVLRVAERVIGRSPVDFDPAAEATALGDVDALIVHDPADEVTAFSNAERFHAHWPGSALWGAEGAGHGIQDAATTRGVVDFLLTGKLPVVARDRSGGAPIASRRHELGAYFAPLERGAGHGGGRAAYYDR